MGSVWRATHVTLNTTVALKIIKRGAARNARSLARFEREARLVARIVSAHVVRVTDHGHHDGAPFIVMDHLAGEDLRVRLASWGQLGLEETARVVDHTCRALTAAHAVGLVHRDIKPENLFICPAEPDGQERIVVLDFGVAKVCDAMSETAFAPTQTGTLVGTPYYLSPEQARGLKTLGPPADMWSLAVVAFECVTGARAFSAASIGPLIQKIVAGPIPVPSQLMAHIPPALDGWFRRALARDPSQRFPTPKQMSRSFASAIGEEEPASPGEHRQAFSAAGRLDDINAANTIVLPDAAHTAFAARTTRAHSESLSAPSVAQAHTLALPEQTPTIVCIPDPAAQTIALPEAPLPAPPRLPAPAPSAWPTAPTHARSPAFGIAIAGLIAVGLGATVAASVLLRAPEPAPAVEDKSSRPTSEDAGTEDAGTEDAGTEDAGTEDAPATAKGRQTALPASASSAPRPTRDRLLEEPRATPPARTKRRRSSHRPTLD